MKINELKKIRKSQGMTQTEFAEALGFSLSSVTNWETNDFEPSPKAIKKIIEFCKNHNIPLEW